MTLNSYLRGLVVVSCVCGMLVGAGCKSKKPPVTPPPPEGNVIPEKIGDSVLPPRDPDGLGTKLTGAEVEFAKNIQFDYDSFQIKDSEVEKIKAAGEFMKAHGDVTLVCEGNCDERGTAEYNMSLGENRALAVRAYLIGLSVDGTKVMTKSFGKEKPVDTGHTEAAHAKNRRVEFAFYRK